MAVSVADVLSLEPLTGAEILGGEAGLSDRTVEWVSVIHPPAASFVRTGEMVLTTGVGCPSGELSRFVLEVADAGAAALGMSFPPDRDGAAISPSALDEIDRRDFPIFLVDWQVPFTDITRSVVDRLLEDRYTARLDGTDRLFQRFVDAVFEGRGLSGVIHELELCIGRGALIFDDRWQVLRYGQGAVTRLGDTGLAAVHRRSRVLEPAQIADLQEHLAAEEPHASPAIETLGLPEGRGMAIRAAHRSLGYLYVIDNESEPEAAELTNLDIRAMEAAGGAVAVEFVREGSQLDELTATRQEFLWEFLTCQSPSEQAIERAEALGLASDVEYELAVTHRADDPTRHESVQQLADCAAQKGLTCIEVSRPDTFVLLVAGDDVDLREMVERVDQREAIVTWGLARGPTRLHGLAGAYQEASLAFKISKSLRNTEPIADASALEPFIMLGGLADDAYAVDWACRAIQPLYTYDAHTGRNLLETLEVYLEEGLNTSSAARRLHLNRHSLQYRLRKIESLTDRSLNHPGDRFLLELSLRLHRFGVLPATREEAAV